MNIMKLLFFTIFSFLFVNLSVCLDEGETMKYPNCRTKAYKCGAFDNIRYPFSGMGRPGYCGLPGFYLDCYENSKVYLENIERYRVLTIDQQKKIMTIVKPDFLTTGDCPWPGVNTSFDFAQFKTTERVVNITLFTDCRNWSREYQFGIHIYCSTEYPKAGYIIKTQSLTQIPKQNLPICNNIVEVPVMKANLDSILASGSRNVQNDIVMMVSAGFEVSYDVTTEISNCKICKKSGGECGYEKRLEKTTCFCPDGRSTRTSARNRTTQRCAGTSGAVFSICLLFLLVLVIFLRNKQRERRNDQQIVEAFYKNKGSLALKRYKYFDVKKMTSYFKEKLGQGGYGSVFKGKLHDGHLVAVKLLFANSKNNGEEFINEVESISKTSHVNVVNLLGFCLEGKKRALIYEFMPNGSLEKFIHNKMPPLTSEEPHSQLGGDTLYQIAVGIARGLQYLHQGCNTQILHFDIKPHNILLDEEFCPKIADFGLAKLCTRKDSMISFLGTRGTTGYIAPEVFSRNFGGVSYKSDVYSYGMMILEMVGGRKNIDVGVGMDHSSQLYYPHWIYERLKQNEDLGLHGIIFTEASEEISRKMSIVGLWCIQANPTNRPSMTKVLEMLESSNKTLEIPPKPFFCSPSRPSPLSSPTAVLMSSKYSPLGSQPKGSSTITSMST